MVLLSGCGPKPIPHPPVFQSSAALAGIDRFLIGRWQEDDDPEGARRSNPFARFNRMHAPLLTFRPTGRFELKARFCTVHGSWRLSGDVAILRAQDVDGYTREQVEGKCRTLAEVPVSGIPLNSATYPWDVTVNHFHNAWIERADALDAARTVETIRIDSDGKRLVSAPSDNPNGSAGEVIWDRT